MTYRTSRRLAGAGTTVLASFAFLFVPYLAKSGIGLLPMLVLSALTFTILFMLRDYFAGIVDRRIGAAYFGRNQNRIVLEFAERVGAAFTIQDLVEAVREKLEKPADVAVLLIRSNTWDPIYRSPSAVSSDPAVFETLERNFRDWTEGFCFINDEYGIASDKEEARGFLAYSKGFHFFAFTRVCPWIEDEAFRSLYGELQIYFDRVITVSDLFEVASLSKEWELVAATQRSFLPKNLPETKKLELAVAYHPLINVSGDFYDVLKVDDARTLLVLGDVSGKGLAAGLIMGIVVNTIRIAPDKADLPALVRSVDAAVREMGFDDKYTVLFLGLADTAKRSFRYVNAAMADPLIVSQTALGPKIRKLPSTMGLIGIGPLDAEIAVEELPLRTDEFIVLASDGFTEVKNAAGRPLDNEEILERTILESSKSGAGEFVNALTGLLYSYVGDSPLKDDVTILAAKAGRLWD
jgi:serine phosphatase RsbU (regulator of sigma subunit)